MKNLLIIAHSPSANTAKLKEALIQSVKESGAALHTQCLSPFDTNAAQLEEADGIILFTTENFGYMSGALKDFFDRTYYPSLETKRGLPYALVVRAGKDGTGAKRATETIIKGLGWKKVQEALLLKGPYSTDFEAKIRELGEAFSIGLSEGMF